MTSGTLAANVASPQLTGTAITFTANGSGGSAPYQYQWYVQKDGGAWQMLRAWSTTTTYTWTPTQPGNYKMAIWARSSGVTANVWEAYAERAFVINGQSSSEGTAPSVPSSSGRMTSGTLAVNLPSPRPTGTAITFTASGSGGSGPYQYQWYVQKDGGVWQMLRAWSTATTYTWTPTQPGSYMMAIWARSSGATANVWEAYAEQAFVVTSGASGTLPMTSATLGFDRPSGQRRGTTITATAAGTGGTAPYQYQWYVQRNGGVWQLVRQWSTNSTLSWTPTQEGQYVVAIWARSYGSTANAWQAYAEGAFLIVP
jgi:hypothetical protein